jgi:hypothetical protein
MDHSQATQLVDGQYDQIFAVRDLASHFQLAWQAVSSTGAAEACQILEKLFQEHGAPLIIKSDQGSAFISTAMRRLLERYHVTALFSPRRRPQYNGALERANSTHKAYTHQQALTQGHPHFWTSVDLESACQLANRIARPWGHQGPSPEQAWEARQRVSPTERQRFAEQLAAEQAPSRAELGAVPIGPLTAPQQDRVERRAISDALERLGYFIKRPVVRLPRMRRRRATVQLQRALREQRASAAPAVAADAQIRAGPDQEFTSRLDSVTATDTMCAELSESSQATATDDRGTTHRESPAKRFWRAAFTPLIRLAKVANIMC